MVFETASRGISSVLNVIEKFGKGSTGGSAVERIVGEAMALLCVCAEIKSAYALTLSREVKRVLKENAVYVE